jgi:high-affinity iron transporter
MKSAVAALLPAALLTVLLAACGSSHGSSAPHTRATARVTITATDTTAPARISNSYVAPVSTIQLAPSVARYTIYVDRLIAVLRHQVAALHATAARGSLAPAESDWTTAHFTYLELGEDDDAYGVFGELGEQIDGLADGLPRTIHNPNFTGFHKIELDLWGRHSTAAAAIDSSRLVTLVRRLTPTLVQDDLPLTAIGVDSWVLRCHEILEDGLRDSLSQDDDYGSNTDLASLAADVDATDEMLAVLSPLIEAREPKIVPTAISDLRVLARAITKAGGPAAHRNLRTVPLRERQALDAATGAAVETLAPVSEILQVTVPGS